MGWPPTTVLDQEPWAFMAALDGWQIANGHKKPAPSKADLAELDELMELYPDDTGASSASGST